MLKNKTKIIALLLTIIFILSATISFADDETNADNQLEEVQNATETQLIDNEFDSEEDQTDITPSLDFKKNDVYLVDKDVKIDYIVDGNIFVIAENVTISSQIGGDAFICAKNITIEKEGYIFSNLFAAGESITVNGVIYDGYLAANNINISGYVYRDLKATSNNLNIYGVIGRNVYASINSINFTNSSENSEEPTVGKVTGDLDYTSPNEGNIPDGSVGGNINFAKQVTNNSKTISITDYIVDAITAIVTAAIIWLLCLWLAPKLLTNTETILSKKLLPILGFGFLGLIVLPIVSILLLCLGVTSILGIILLLLYFVLLLASSSVFVIAMNSALCKKINVTKKLPTFGILVGLALVLWIIKLIPVIGGFVSFIAMVIGLGVIIRNILPHKENELK